MQEHTQNETHARWEAPQPTSCNYMESHDQHSTVSHHSATSDCVFNSLLMLPLFQDNHARSTLKQWIIDEDYFSHI